MIVEANWEKASFQDVLNMLYLDILSREQNMSTPVKEVKLSERQFLMHWGSSNVFKAINLLIVLC